MSNYDLIERLPTIQEFSELRISVGWPEVNEKILANSLGSSLYSVCAVAGEKAIGVARIVGDGALYFYIQDVVVHPCFQGKGIGKAMLKKIMNYLDLHAPESSFIGLMAAKGKEGFYRNFGFIERPNDKYGAGMCIYKTSLAQQT